MKRTFLSCASLLLAGVAVSGGVVRAQPPIPNSPYYQPLNQATPPGVAGQWAGALGRADCRYFQPVKVTVAGGGNVTFIDTASGRQQTLASPAQAGLLVGPLYRIKISDMPQFPGVELYPSLEMVDRLHPPAHLKDDYPIPVELSELDLRQAMEDQLVTKIVYLEQPDMAAPRANQGRIREDEIPQNKNLMTEADLRGRPVLYVRVGGRIPAAHELLGTPYTAPAPVEFAAQKTPSTP